MPWLEWSIKLPLRVQLLLIIGMIFLVIAPTYDSCLAAMYAALQIMMDLGFEINWKKVIYPATKVPFLGIVIDSQRMKASIPPEKLRDIKNKAIVWLDKKKATKRELQSLAGSIAWGAKCVKAIRPVLRGIIDLYKGLKSSHHHVRIPRTVKLDIQYFIQWCETFNGVSFGCDERSLPFTSCYTDASLEMGGGHCKGDFFHVNWDLDLPAVKTECIYVKELAAMYVAVVRWGPRWAGHRVKMYTDNQGALWALRKGLTKNSLANMLVRGILWSAAHFDITLEVDYLPSQENILADALSRLSDPYMYHLSVMEMRNRGIVDKLCLPYFLMHMSIAALLYLLSRYQDEGTISRCLGGAV